MLATDFSSSAKFLTCLRIPFGSLWGSALPTAVDVDSCTVEDFISLAGVILTVHLSAGIQTHLVNKPEVEGGSEEGRGGGGGGREGHEGRRGRGGEEADKGEGGTESGGRGGGLEGGEGVQEREKGVRIREGGGKDGGGGGGGGGRRGGVGGEMFGGCRRFLKMFLLVSIVNIQVGVSLLKEGEFKMHGIEGESSKEQSAGEMMALGFDLSSTVLETVGKVENVEWGQGEENKESEDRDFICSVPCIISESPSLISSFSVKLVSSVVSKGLLLPLLFGWVSVLSFLAFCLLLRHCSRSMVSVLLGGSHIDLLGKRIVWFHIFWIFSLGPLRDSFLACALDKNEPTESVLTEKSEFVDLGCAFSL